VSDEIKSAEYDGASHVVVLDASMHAFSGCILNFPMCWHDNNTLYRGSRSANALLVSVLQEIGCACKRVRH
jgi:hypothetical protein